MFRSEWFLPPQTPWFDQWWQNPTPPQPPPAPTPSPVTAPGGTPPAGSAEQWASQFVASPPPAPPGPSPTPQVQAYLALQQMQAAAQQQQQPAPVAPQAPTNPLMAAQAQPVTDASDRRDQPPPQLNPLGGGGVAVQNFVNRTQDRWRTIGNSQQDTYDFPGPYNDTMAELGASNDQLAQMHSGEAGSVLGTRTNPDGSSDYIINSGAGAPIYTPRSRIVPPSPLMQLGRMLGASLGTILDVAQVGAQAVRGVVGQAAQGNLRLTQPVPLSGGTTYQPPAMTDTAAQAQALVAGGGSGGRLVDAVHQLYGYTPQTQAALEAVTQMAYSSPEAQLQAVDRMVKLGQTPETAIHGEGDYASKVLAPLGYLDDPLKAIRADPSAEYAYRILKGQGKSDADIINVFNTAGLPGAEDLLRETIGLTVLDPLLLVGDLPAKAVEGMRAEQAAKWMARPATLEEAVGMISRDFRPTGNAAVDALIPWARTPSAAADKTVELAHNAASLILSDASNAAGKAGEIDGAVRPSVQTVMRALVDSAEQAPVRAIVEAEGGSYETALRAWESQQASAKVILGPYPVSQSAAGRLAASLTRRLMADEAGQVTSTALDKLLLGADGKIKPVNQILEPLMKRYQQAAVDLLTPERQGATGVLDFMATTGKTAQEYPIFERGLAASLERAQVAQKVTQAADKLRAAGEVVPAGLAYKLSPADATAVGFTNIKNNINAGLWAVFARFSPAYTARNALNNTVTALTDGTLAVEKGADVDAFLGRIGHPLAASKGIGSGGLETTGDALSGFLKGGFAGDLKVGNLPVGAQAVEMEFGKRAIFKGAKNYLDRTMVLGKGIPELPPGLAEALGPELSAGLVSHLRNSYGDVDAALEWLGKQMGASELWRMPSSAHLDALSEFHFPTADKVFNLAQTAETPEAFRAGMAAIRAETRASLGAIDAATPNLAAMSDEVAASHADDLTRAAEAGVTANPKDFEARLTAQRTARDRAQNVAMDALQANPTPENVADMRAVQQKLSGANATTRKAVDAARAEAWDKTAQWRSMAATGKKSSKQAGAVVNNIWAKYFKFRDEQWSGVSQLAVDEWRNFSTKLGTTFAPEAETLAATEKAAQTLKPNIPGGAVNLTADARVAADQRIAEAGARAESAGFGSNGQALDFEAARALKNDHPSRVGAVRFDYKDSATGLTGKNANRWNADLSTGTVEPPKLWVNEARTNWQYQPPSAKGAELLSGTKRVKLTTQADALIAKNGEKWTRVPASQIDGWVENFAEAAGYDVGQGVTWDQIEHDLVNELNGPRASSANMRVNAAQRAQIDALPPAQRQAAIKSLRQQLADSQQQVADLTKKLNTDSLTGLGNRSAWEMAVSQRAPDVPVFHADFNGLKYVNDTYGHPAGDTLLRSFSQAAIEEGIDPAALFHPSGDEFNGLGVAEDQIAALRARLSQSKIRITDAKGDIHELTGLTFSYGYGTGTDAESAAEAGLQSAKSADVGSFRAGGRGPNGESVAPPSLVDQPGGPGRGLANSPLGSPTGPQATPQVAPLHGGTQFDIPLPGGPVKQAAPVNALGTPFEAAATRANPIPSKWTKADQRSILSTLDALEAQTLGSWGKTRPFALDEAGGSLLNEWGAAARKLSQEGRAIAGAVGTEARNFALLNYSDKRNMDTWLSLVMPYHYWYFRTYGNWLKRAVMNPAVLGAYGRYRSNLDEMHAALPDYWKQQLTTEDLGIKMDTPWMFNLEATLSPLYGLTDQQFSSPERRRANLFGVNGAGAMVEDLNSFGPQLWAPITWAMSMSSAMKGDTQAANAWTNNYLGGGFRALRSVSALANEVFTANGGHSPMPAGGINPDPQMFINQMVAGRGGPSVKTMTPWESNRVGKILTDMLASPPPGTDPKDWQAKLGEAAYTQSGDLWNQAMQQMFKDTAPAVLASYFMGVGFKGRAGYETEFSQINSELNTIRTLAPNLTKEEITQKYLDLARRHPDYELASLSQQSGPTRDDPWVWEAVSRVGIANNAAWLAAGVSQGALDAFYKVKSTQGMDPQQREELLKAATAINSVTRPATIEERQQQLDARTRYLKVQNQLVTKYGAGISDLEQQYYAVRDKQGREAAKAWLDGQPSALTGSLYAMWDERTAALAGDPLVSRYYVDPERFRSLKISQWNAEQEQANPGIGDLADAYHALRLQDATAASTLLTEHPELKVYWKARDVLFNSELPAAVKAWAAGLPDSSQGALRLDVVPGGPTQLAVAKAHQTESSALALAERTGDVAAAGGNNTASLLPTTPQQALIDKYQAQADQARADKLEAQTYLKTENRKAFIDNTLQPLVDSLGPQVAARQLLVPFFDASTGQPAAWSASQFGVQGILAWMGEAGSFREALMAHASTENNANWARYVAVLRDMPPEQLAQLSKQYPQLADAAMVADAAQGHDYPSLAALDDILGVTVTIDEDGSISVGKQAVTISAKDKKLLAAGKLDPQAFVGGKPAAGAASGGGGLSSSTLKRLTASVHGGGGGGGGGSDKTTQSAAQTATDQQLGDWMKFEGELKLTQPDLLVLFKDYLDAGDLLYKEQLLRKHPELYAYLQSLGDAKLVQLMQAYAAFRAATTPAATTAQKNSARSAGINILRTYTARPAASGLPG